MKCIRKHGATQVWNYPKPIARVSDDEAEQIVKAGKGVYVPKQAYKEQERRIARNFPSVSHLDDDTPQYVGRAQA